MTLGNSFCSIIMEADSAIHYVMYPSDLYIVLFGIISAVTNNSNLIEYRSGKKGENRLIILLYTASPPSPPSPPYHVYCS